MKKFTASLVAGLLVLATHSPAGAQTTTDTRRIEDIRQALLRMPYYGVFDFLTFTYEKGTVTLGGYAYHGTLKGDAEKVVKRVGGVDQVVNNIVELPVGQNDDEIRWNTFYAIYTNAFLSRYAPGGGLLWGHRHPYRRSMIRPFGLFPGMQPVGNYPIHIVVERGRIRLLGVVDTNADKTAAGLAARGVPGSFGVENELLVDGGK
jgi:hyperosmotically inducible periplasmic protein